MCDSIRDRCRPPRKNQSEMSEPEPIQTLYQPGDVVGPFKIEGLLGSGAFADVYLARNVHLDERVALKVVRHVEAEPLEQQGAQMMYRLQHPNVVRVTFGDRIDGRLVLAMDYVDGETLTAALRKSGSLPVAPGAGNCLRCL